MKDSTKNMILGVTNIMKNRKNAEKSSAQKLFQKIGEKLKFLEYHKIDMVSMDNYHVHEDINYTNQSNFETLGTYERNSNSTKRIVMHFLRTYGVAESDKPSSSSC